MSDQNFLSNAGDFVTDAAVDTTVDNVLNQGIHALASHIPGGESVEQMAKTEVDQVVNNAINAELKKGVGGIMGDIEGFFGHHHNG